MSLIAVTSYLCLCIYRYCLERREDDFVDAVVVAVCLAYVYGVYDDGSVPFFSRNFMFSLTFNKKINHSRKLNYPKTE